MGDVELLREALQDILWLYGEECSIGHAPTYNSAETCEECAVLVAAHHALHATEPSESEWSPNEYTATFDATGVIESIEIIPL